MAGGIFISYRRDDAKHAAGRLVDRLVAGVGRDKLFMDVDNIEPGLDFVKVLNDQVSKCDVLLALIGPQWLDSRDASGARRLDNPADFVRIEIDAALARDIRVVPVLLDGAEMPAIETLPPNLHPLLRRQAVRISHERFAGEADDLAVAMKRALGVIDPPLAPPPAQKVVSTPVSWSVLPAKPTREVEDGPPPPDNVLSRVPIVLAISFAVAALPALLFTLDYLAAVDWRFFGKTNKDTEIFASITFALGATALAAAIIRWRGNALTAGEVALYWLGSALVCGFTMVVFFVSMGWRFFSGGEGAGYSGVLVGFLVAVLSGIVVRRWWQRRQT